MKEKRVCVNKNICGKRVRQGRKLQMPPITQAELARRITRMGVRMNEQTIAGIENGQRRVNTMELLMLGIALDVSLDWLCERSSDPCVKR